MVLELRGVSKSYGRVRALRGLTMSVGRGVTGLVGPNGAGKTTTIKISLGLLRADEGIVRFFGLDPWVDGYEVRRRVGVLHERPSYPGDLTGLQFLKYVASFYGVRDCARRAAEVLRLVGLEFAAHRPIKSYSAGMVQRLGIAKAIVGEPEFVVLDEPTANLDPTSRAEILDLILTLHEDEGMSFLISTHVLSELERVCDRVLVMCGGRVVAEGTLSELIDRYGLAEYVVELPEPRALAGRLANLDFVEEVRVDEKRGRVLVRARDAYALTKAVFEAALELNLRVVSVRPRYGALEQVYRRVVGRETAGVATGHGG